MQAAHKMFSSIIAEQKRFAFGNGHCPTGRVDIRVDKRRQMGVPELAAEVTGVLKSKRTRTPTRGKRHKPPHARWFLARNGGGPQADYRVGITRPSGILRLKGCSRLSHSGGLFTK